MHTYIVHAHPEPASYNAALTNRAACVLRDRGGTVTVSDLYRLNFDPVEGPHQYLHRANSDYFAALAEQRHAWANGSVSQDVRGQVHNLDEADLVILQFPLWWHGPPAILKGWMDRVFVNGGLYTSRMRYDTGYFRGRRAVLSVTTGAPKVAFGAGNRGGDFDVMLWPLHYSLHYMGFSILPPFITYGVDGHGFRYDDDGCLQDRLESNLTDWSAYLTDLDEAEPLRFPGWSHWDKNGSAFPIAGG